MVIKNHRHPAVEQLDEKLENAYQSLDNLMTGVESGEEELPELVANVEKAYNFLYKTWKGDLETKGSLNQIPIDDPFATKFIQIVLARGIIEGYKNRFAGKEYKVKTFKDDELFMPKNPDNPIYNLSEIYEGGKSLGYQNRTDIIRRIIPEFMNLE